MADAETVRQIALSLPEVTEGPHFEKTSFRVNKKIFATIDAVHSQANVKLSATDQDVFSAFDHTIIFPVANKWGKQGWTTVDLQRVRQEMLTDIIKTAYCEVAPKKLAEFVSFDD